MPAEIGLERHVEHLDVNLAHVMAHPLLEDVNQKATVLFASDRTLGYEVAVLRVKQALAVGLLAPAQIGDVDRLFGGALNDRDELHPLRAHLITKETIDRAAMFLVGGVDRAEYVEFDSVLAQVLPALHHLVESTFLRAVQPVSVVEFAWPVDAQANQKVVFLKEGAPLIIEKDAVGLESVFHDLLGAAILFDEFDRAPEELELHQRRLTPLPGHCYRGRAVRLQQLADVGLERRIGHPILFVRIQRFLGEEETISAINVASGPARLCQQMEARRRVLWPSIVWPDIFSHWSHVHTIFVTATKSAASPGSLGRLGRRLQPRNCQNRQVAGPSEPANKRLGERSLWRKTATTLSKRQQTFLLNLGKTFQRGRYTKQPPAGAKPWWKDRALLVLQPRFFRRKLYLPLRLRTIPVDEGCEILSLERIHAGRLLVARSQGQVHAAIVGQNNVG
jgi:hypothetical protein